ncbi:MAG: glycosyltransferase family 39 protein [Anaerolineales bacterium]|nr:glycosyltransferase family 39 protein [Anaerolineales bacterium]
MNVKDAHKLFLWLALLLGGIVRFAPVAMAGFPVNDGGMFYVMVEELQANHFLLPAFTQYNLVDIPFAYPPFGLYASALISSLLRIPALDVVRWLPPLVSTLSLLAFYLLADEILGSRIQAALATIFYGLVPDSFGWAIMGGGITRSFGLLFLFLTIAFANRLYKRTSSLHAVLTAIFGALAFLSHPETGLQAAAACILLWLFRGRSMRTLLWSAVVAFGVAALTAPWWGTVLAQHGLAPFQSAMQTSNDGAFHLAELLTLQLGDGVFFSLTVALGVIGFLGVLARRKFLLPVWLVVPFFVDPRSAGGMAFLPMSILAAYGFDQLLAPALLSLRGREGEWLTDHFVTLSFLGIAFYLFFSSGIFGVGLVSGSLSAADRETIAWVDANIPAGSDFLLLTGEQYSMKDPFQEWFPALTNQHSQTTLQGAEWTLGADFFPFYGELVALQHCADVSCIEAWGERTGLEHQYLLVKVLTEESNSSLRASLALLLDSVRDSEQYEPVHETDNAIIFQYDGNSP